MKDPRYIVLTEQGQAVTLGRVEPTAADVAQALDGLTAQGLRGWLVLASASFHARCKPVLTMLRSLNEPAEAFAHAAQKAGGKSA